ncbi:hypothetical protein JMN32_21275 [Fulvivirga sp. 29W222]|uniref:Uncharacterized protein n=1 Tax=Fulvivirga marina TaxID=2494733 RepID=A0A937G1N7_9BACT|nr:hypothetical protein [Fulvivirga marina]MBL6448858.1 hypothetical protein [Fulvivirga marina]
MEKSILLDSIYECVEACENLTTTCAQSSNKTFGKSCLNQALACTDAGMILIIKLNEEPNSLHKNLFIQFIKCCQACINACVGYRIYQTLSVIMKCRKAIEYCSHYIVGQHHTNTYQFTPPSHSLKKYTQLMKSITPQS